MKKSIDLVYTLFIVGVSFLTLFASAFLTGMGDVSSAFGMMAVVMLYNLFLWLFEKHSLEERANAFVKRFIKKEKEIIEK